MVMAVCAGLAAVRRAGLIVSIPPVLLFLLLLQLLVGFGGLGGGFSRRGGGVGGEEVIGGWWGEGEETRGGGRISFSVISIEPERRSGPPHREGGAAASSSSSFSVGPDLDGDEEEEKDDGGDGVERRGGEEESLAARGYEDENEMPTRQGQGQGVELQSWAAGEPSFAAELERLMAYMTTPQVNCSRVLLPGQSQVVSQHRASGPPGVLVVPGQSQVVSQHRAPPGGGGPTEAWLLCAEDWLLPAAHSPCVAYSFSMDGGDADFLKTALGLGCEVHRFDPGSLNAAAAAPSSSGGHQSPAAGSGKSLLAGRHGDHGVGGGGGGGVVTHHKMWLEWRAAAPRRKRHPRRRGGGGGGALGSVSHTLADIMEALGHHTVDFLYADLLSAEWRVFQNWLELETLGSVHHLVATAHLQWAGFEVGGTDEEVLRYWFSVLQGLRASGFRLVHSSPRGEGRGVLKRTVESGHSSSYTLSWVNMRH